MASETAVLGGGCFWCTEAVYLEVKGVTSVESGYTGGQVPDPTYEQVCAGETGHAEVVKLEFDPDVIPTTTCWKSSSPSTTRPRSTARATTSARSTAR